MPDAETTSYELLIYPFRTPEKGNQALKELERAVNSGKAQVVTAAAVAKEVNGETSVKATLDSGRNRGLRRGALAGGLLAVLAPPVGVLGLAAGAAVGALAGRRQDERSPHNFAGEFLDRVLAEMGGGSSALVVLARSAHANDVTSILNEANGEPIRQVLPREAVEYLLRTGEQKAPPPGLSQEETDELKRLLQEGTRRDGLRYDRAFVIINPASGKDATILNTLNSVFRATGLSWDVGITNQAGDATRQAAEAAEAGYDVVAVYGGDGTVMEAAAGLQGSEVPLAILPGGTNNVMSVELGIPKNLAAAAALVNAAPVRLQAVDMGRANEHHFILRLGVGYEAVINETADREMKDRFGGFAYTLAGLKALQDPPVAHYRLTIDGRVEELEGLWCMVANSASLGIPNLELVQDISVDDGLLDVIIVRRADLESLLSIVSSVSGAQRLGKPLPHWQAKRISVEADPPQAVTGDGEIWENTPLEIEVVPQAVNILVPAPD